MFTFTGTYLGPKTVQAATPRPHETEEQFAYRREAETAFVRFRVSSNYTSNVQEFWGFARNLDLTTLTPGDEVVVECVVSVKTNAAKDRSWLSCSAKAIHPVATPAQGLPTHP